MEPIEPVSKIDIMDVAAPVKSVEAPVVAERKVAHVHQADKRANQRGPITDYNTEVGSPNKVQCYETTYHVRNPGGLRINEKLFKGKVVVPECVANTLCDMDGKWEEAERWLYRDGGRTFDANGGVPLRG